MTDKTLNKHELRTRETRAHLLAAAEAIFLRDGYEGTELGEIAALAGRTKGAIYAHYKSKEDIFLALFEDRAQRYRVEMESMVVQSASAEENLKTLRDFFLNFVEDRAWSLLLLEFKLFALRHPASKKRLEGLFSGMIGRQDEGRLAEILGAAGKGKGAISRVEAVVAMQPMVSGLVLESQLKTNLLNKDVLKKVLNRIFDALLEVPAR